MKIMIVDDEILVRNGLKNSVNWEDYGISTVLLAEDGVQALKLAQRERPELVLTDVRMPRMDGIQLATCLRKCLPNSHLIFMSGYSDKEYLKAAIQLKAVSYVEKPIDLAEVTKAVSDAVRLQKEFASNLEAQIIRSRMEKAQLAAALLQINSENEASIRKAWNALELPNPNKLWFATILIQFLNIADCNTSPRIQEIFVKLQDTAQQRHISFLHSVRSDNRIFLHIYREVELTREHISWLATQLQKAFGDDYQFFISAGPSARGLGSIEKTLALAQEALNGSFYDAPNSILLWDNTEVTPVSIDFDRYITEFRNAVSAEEYEKATALEEELFAKLQNQRQIPMSLVKNTYYQFISILEWVATKICISFSATAGEQSPWQIVSGSKNLLSLRTYFHNLLDAYIRQARNEPEENELVFRMKEFIRKNYQRDMLSVREIAESACLSTAYACTMFKNETGTTINQFISHYRIERAKQLLADPRNKITDIAAQLGYTDSNYFGKNFKKLVGLSPSEYREKVSKWVL